MSFEPGPLLRRLRPERWSEPLTPRPADELPFFNPDSVVPSSRFLLDTSVLIDALQGRLPLEVARLLSRAYIAHSTVVLAEFAFALGRLSPADPRTRQVRTVYERRLREVREDRVVAPDLEVSVEAGVLNGILARLTQMGDDQRHRRFNDCLIYLSARKHSLMLLTRNARDFDLISQIAPNGRLLFYRQGA